MYEHQRLCGHQLQQQPNERIEAIRVLTEEHIREVALEGVEEGLNATDIALIEMLIGMSSAWLNQSGNHHMMPTVQKGKYEAKSDIKGALKNLHLALGKVCAIAKFNLPYNLKYILQS